MKGSIKAYGNALVNPIATFRASGNLKLVEHLAHSISIGMTFKQRWRSWGAVAWIRSKNGL